MMSLSPNAILDTAALSAVKERIEAARRRGSYAVRQVTLVAVTKAFPVETMISACNGGLLILGESRVQESEAKLPHFLARERCEIHLIGHLQANKARKALQLYNVIESVDSLKLLERLERIAAEMRLASFPVFLQVNTGRDPNKYGFLAEEIIPLLDRLKLLNHLQIVGIMTIAPLGLDEEDLRSCFRETREIRDTVRETIPSCRYLSMGMSDDFELAIEEGATHVRIGRALFGERPARQGL